MKKIFYFLLLMLSGFVWGQRPTIYPLTGGFTFEGERLEKHTLVFNAATSSCSFNFSDVYKYYSFKANFDMVFAFDLIATKPDFKFLVWKLPVGSAPESIFTISPTIIPNRTVEGTFNVKGMKEGDSNLCEGYTTSGSNGYAKAFEGTDILKKDESIVIAIYGSTDTDLFDIKVNVAEEKSITTFNNLCIGQSYTASQVFNTIQSDSGLNNIKLFADNTFSTEIPIGTTFTANTIIYAQVRDASSNLKYIYTIPIAFIPDHQFNFKSTIDTEYACTTIYTIPSQDDLLNKLFPTVDINYSISSIVIDATSYTPGQTVNLTVGQNTTMKIKVHYGGGCPLDSNEVLIPLKQGSPVLSTDISDATCEASYKIDFDLIYSKLGVDKSSFDLIVTLGGVPILNGQSTPITTTLNYQVKIKSISGGACESNEVNLLVTRTSPANIITDEIKDICLSDFNQTHVDNAIDRIQNGNNYNLKFYQPNGTTEILRSDLFNYIQTTKVGNVVVKALAADNGNTICDTTKDLRFKLDESTFVLVTNIPTFNSSCSEAGLGHIFTISEIETYLKTQFGRTDITFSGISNHSLADNGSATITFQVKINGETCWSDEMQLTLQVITKPNVASAIYSDEFCEGESLTIDDNLLRDNFVANVFDYKILIDGTEYIQGSSIQKVLNFGTNTSLNISVEFKNRLRETCSTTVNLSINKKQDLIVDVASLETYTLTNEIVYCEGDDINAKNQILVILDYIKSQYPTLVSKSSVDEIFNQFNSEEGFVNVNFDDPNYCGTVAVKLFYKKNALPNFEIPTSDQICSDSKFEIDFEELAKVQSLDITDYVFLVTGDDVTKTSAYKYELGIGDYTIIISNSNSGCPKEYILKLTNSETPSIDKITINEKSIIVSAKGKGKLEYALFDSNGVVIVDWQTNNELIIPSNITDNNFSVKVRLNNCGISERKNVIYLALPNLVTPNNDGYNDVWQPMTKDGKVNDTSNSYRLTIFDRLGKHILSQEGTDIIKWDGTHNGKPVADGTYWYLLEFSKQSDDLQVLYSGSILVKRKFK